jgi:Gliding motility associated protein GldN
MKLRIPVLALFIFHVSVFSSPAQVTAPRAADQMIRSLFVNRINLKEPANRSLTQLPDVLLTGWRMGLVQGYYPGAVDVPMPWDELARKFQVVGSPLDGARAKFDCCAAPTFGVAKGPGGQVQDATAAPLRSIRYAQFGLMVELIESRIVDRNRSEEIWVPQYVRIVFHDPEETLPERAAVVFKWADVETVLGNVRMEHPENDAATLSVKQHIVQRDFVAYPVEVRGQAVYTLNEAEQRRLQELNRTDQNRRND